MIKFFRKIRQKLLSENLPTGQAGKFSKYLLYAIGEILLVIIGILIAVSINTWNENRKLKIQEQSLLKDLRTEVAANLIDLDTVIQAHEQSYEAALELRKLHVSRNAFDTTANRTYGSLLFKMNQNHTFDPNNGILNSMISSGQINNLSNKDLKYLLASLKDKTADAFEDANKIEQQRDEPTRRMWTDAYIKKNGKLAGFDIRRTYENAEYHVLTHALFILNRRQGLDEENTLKETMKHILELIEQEIDK